VRFCPSPSCCDVLTPDGCSLVRRVIATTVSTNCLTAAMAILPCVLFVYNRESNCTSIPHTCVPATSPANSAPFPSSFFSPCASENTVPLIFISTFSPILSLTMLINLNGRRGGAGGSASMVDDAVGVVHGDLVSALSARRSGSSRGDAIGLGLGMRMGEMDRYATEVPFDSPSVDVQAPSEHGSHAVRYRRCVRDPLVHAFFFFWVGSRLNR